MIRGHCQNSRFRSIWIHDFWIVSEIYCWLNGLLSSSVFSSLSFAASKTLKHYWGQWPFQSAIKFRHYQKVRKSHWPKTRILTMALENIWGCNWGQTLLIWLKFSENVGIIPKVNLIIRPFISNMNQLHTCKWYI